MPRQIDKKKTRKALRKLKRAADLAAGPDGPGLSDWEKDFVEGVSQRLETYGSAFRDPGKGRLDDALSLRQIEIVRAIDRKARKKKERIGPVAAEGEVGEVSGAETAESIDHGSRQAKLKGRMRSKRPVRRSLPDPRESEAEAETPASPASPATPDQRRAGLRLIVGGAAQEK
jgi:hypothetical protein